MKRALITAALIAATVPAMAQQRPAGQPLQPGQPTNAAPKPPTPEQLRQFAQRFQANVVSGCMKTASQTSKNPRGFCTCYANAFLNRYNAQQLAFISDLAGRSPEVQRTIAVMMYPERQACQANQ